MGVLLVLGGMIASATVIVLLLRAGGSSAAGGSGGGSGDGLVLVASSPNPIVVDAYRGALESVGIPVVVLDEATSRMLGRAPALAMRIMVPEARLSEAQRILRELESAGRRRGA